MRQNTAVILVLAVVIGYYAYTRYGAVSNLRFNPRGITVQGGGFEVTLGVQNTSNVQLQYNSFAGSLIVNGSEVGNISDFTSQPIIANGETPITFSITANLLGLAGQILSQVRNGVSGIQSASISGTANIGGTQYPVNVTLA